MLHFFIICILFYPDNLDFLVFYPVKKCFLRRKRIDNFIAMSKTVVIR